MQEFHKFGALCELRALQYYQARGATILKKNFRCRAGEIDLIVKEGAFLVFVEVRGRSQSHESAVFSVDRRKQGRLIRTARWFLAQEERYLPPGISEIRFDLIAVSGLGAVARIPNAFFL